MFALHFITVGMMFAIDLFSRKYHNMGMKRKDITGQRFNKLVVVSFSHTVKGNGRSYHTYYNCICDCGKTCIVQGTKLRNGHTQSCGCYRHERQIEANTKHNGRYSRLYIVWCNMKGRCYNPNDNRFSNYGGRGITVCEEWKDDFEQFRKWAEKSGYNPGAKRGECTLDRIDVNKEYSPANCRWVNNQVQANNKTTNRILNYKGETKTLSEWARRIGINADTLQSRLSHNWSIEKAIETPLRKCLKKS